MMKLFLSIILGFIAPWILGVYLYRRARLIIAIIVPFASALGFSLNTIGMDLGYFYPTVTTHTFMHSITILANLGLLAIESCLFIFLIERIRISTFLLNILVSLVSSLIDVLFIVLKLLAYNPPWNIYWTFIFYFICFYIINFYYLWVMKLFSTVPTKKESS